MSVVGSGSYNPYSPSDVRRFESSLSGVRDYLRTLCFEWSCVRKLRRACPVSVSRYEDPLDLVGFFRRPRVYELAFVSMTSLVVDLVRRLAYCRSPREFGIVMGPLWLMVRGGDSGQSFVLLDRCDAQSLLELRRAYVAAFNCVRHFVFRGRVGGGRS